MMDSVPDPLSDNSAAACMVMATSHLVAPIAWVEGVPAMWEQLPTQPRECQH